MDTATRWKTFPLTHEPVGPLVDNLQRFGAGVNVTYGIGSAA